MICLTAVKVVDVEKQSSHFLVPRVLILCAKGSVEKNYFLKPQGEESVCYSGQTRTEKQCLSIKDINNNIL